MIFYFISDNDLPKVAVLRRSESERLTSTIVIPPPKFLDTMALRPKSKHGHTSQVFLVTAQDSEIEVQSEKPIHRTDTEKNISAVSHNDSSITDSGNISDNSDITKNVLKHLRCGIPESPEPPPRLKCKERSKSKKNNYVKTRFIRNNSSSSTSDEWSDANDYEQKTILKVKQFDSEEHEVTKIASALAKSSENESRKTSIQINGNECYSTTDANNDTPIYLSSVVVNDDYGNICDTYQSGTTVTISVGTPQKEVKKSKSKIYIGASFPNGDKIEEANNYEEYTAENNRNSYGKQNASVNASDMAAILNDPVEAVRRNLIPHVCGKKNDDHNNSDIKTSVDSNESEVKSSEDGNFVTKLFDDPFFGHLAEGLDSDLVKKLIENSLIKLQESKNQEGADSEITIEKLIESSLKNLKSDETVTNQEIKTKEQPVTENKGESECQERETSVDNDNDNSCSAPYESMEYESGPVGVFSDLEPMSDCYNASASELSTEDDTNSTRSKFYQMLVDAAMCDIEIANNTDDDHHYESIRLNSDPIYEEICDMPPPLPINPPPMSMTLLDDDKRSGSRSIFEGASKYDILSYLVDAKERGIDDEDTYITNYETENGNNGLLEQSKEKHNSKEILDSHLSSNTSQLSNGSDSSEDNSLIINHDSLEKTLVCKKTSAEIERNDSGVGSETSKSSRSRLQGKCSPCHTMNEKDAPIHLCEDCDTAVDTQVTEQGKDGFLFVEFIYITLSCSYS